jgi:hypothetical protein
MADDRRWTAAELERLTPDQRAALLQSRVVTDLADLDTDLVERARTIGRDLLDAPGVLEAPTGDR